MEKREVKIAIAGKVFTIFTMEDEEIIRKGERLVNNKWNESLEKLSNVDSLSRLLLMFFDLAVEYVKEREKNREIFLLEERASKLLRDRNNEEIQKVIELKGE